MATYADAQGPMIAAAIAAVRGLPIHSFKPGALSGTGVASTPCAHPAGTKSAHVARGIVTMALLAAHAGNNNIADAISILRIADFLGCLINRFINGLIGDGAARNRIDGIRRGGGYRFAGSVRLFRLFFGLLVAAGAFGDGETTA